MTTRTREWTALVLGLLVIGVWRGGAAVVPGLDADSTGGLHQYWGQADDAGNIVYLGETPVASPGNARQTVQLTFFNLGPDRKVPARVRQFSEVLGADGRWTVNYDLMYYRRPPRP